MLRCSRRRRERAAVYALAESVTTATTLMLFFFIFSSGLKSSVVILFITSSVRDRSPEISFASHTILLPWDVFNTIPRIDSFETLRQPSRVRVTPSSRFASFIISKSAEHATRERTSPDNFCRRGSAPDISFTDHKYHKQYTFVIYLHTESRGFKKVSKFFTSGFSIHMNGKFADTVANRHRS